MKDSQLSELNKLLMLFENQTKLKLIPKITDDKMELTIISNDYEITFNARIVHFINKARLSTIYSVQKNKQEKSILITDYINPDLHQTMINLGMNYIDFSGNCYINFYPIIINIKGNKKRNTNSEKIRARIPNAAGLQVIYTLLCNKDLIEASMAEIAEISKTAIGTVFNTIKFLNKQGFIITSDNKRKTIINSEELFKQWIVEYPNKLKPKIFYGRYVTSEENFWEKTDVKKYGALWGGETAAAKLTNYLTPYLHTLYFSKNPGEFILRNKLKLNKEGNIEILYSFWDSKLIIEDVDCVNPILVYADLLASGDSRNIETANILYEKDIVGHLK